MFGNWVEQLDIQLGVVLGQRLVAVMVDELHHGAEGQRVGEAVLSLPVEDLYQLVVASFPEGGTTAAVKTDGYIFILRVNSVCARVSDLRVRV